MSNDERDDRAAILTRRELLIAAALAACGGGGQATVRPEEAYNCLQPEYRPLRWSRGVELGFDGDALDSDTQVRLREWIAELEGGVEGLRIVELGAQSPARVSAVTAFLVEQGVPESMIEAGPRPAPSSDEIVEEVGDPAPEGIELWTRSGQ